VSGRRVAASLLLLLSASGCIPSNVVAREERMVVDDVSALDWQPANGVALLGLYETVDVRGEVAASLRKIYYRFAEDGTYTAAALIESAGAFQFQTIDGTWRADENGLVLDDGEPVQLDRADGGYLRIRTETGTIVLQHEEAL